MTCFGERIERPETACYGVESLSITDRTSLFLTRMTKVVIPWSSFMSRLTWSTRLRSAVRENADIGARTPFTVLMCSAL